MSLTLRAMEERACASPQPCTTQSSNRAVPRLPATATSEEAPDYRGVLFYLDPNWRVSTCRHDLQWLLQFRSGTRKGHTRWTSRSYLTSRAGLVRCAGEATEGKLSPEARAFLTTLPVHYGGKVVQP